MLNLLKKTLKSNPAVHKFATTVRSVVSPTTSDLLERMANQVNHVVDRPFFVKVGANDGITGDPFGKAMLDRWSGILIEPVPYCIDRLKRVYTDDKRFTIVQNAVGNTPGVANFYYVSEAAKEALPNLPEWYDQLGSFSREHIVRHLNGTLEPFIETAAIDVVPLIDILKSHHVSEITLLHIDTEGFDLEVLKSLGLPKLCPSWIMLEHSQLSAPDRREMLSILRSNDYDVIDLGSDFFGYHGKAKEGLRRSGRVGRLLAQYPAASA